MRRCANLLKRFPDSDDEALKEKFPLVDINQVKRWKRVLGHHHNYEYDVYICNHINQNAVLIEKPND